MKQLQRRRWKYSFALLVSLSVGSLLTASSVFAYQEVTVTDGGTITGKVTLKGNKPAPRGFNLVIFPDPVYCGRISNGQGFRLLKEFTVAEDRGLKGVLVMLIGIQRGKPFDFPTTRIEARDCRFLPYINVVRRDRKSTRLNSSHSQISYAVFCLKKKKTHQQPEISEHTSIYPCTNDPILTTHDCSLPPPPTPQEHMRYTQTATTTSTIKLPAHAQ